MHDKFSDAGLVIIGVSDEAEQKLADHIEAKGIRYPVVRAPGAMGEYGGRFYPSYFTVSPDGEILTTPDDRMPSEDWLKKALESVVLIPELPDESRYDSLRKAWDKNDYAKVESHLSRTLAKDNLDDEERTVLEAHRAYFDSLIERTSKQIQKLGEGPDFWNSTKRLEKLQKDFKGLPVAAEAEAMLDRFDDDDGIKKEISASRALEKVQAKFDANKISQRRKLVEALAAFEEKFAGTHAASEAAALRVRLAQD